MTERFLDLASLKAEGSIIDYDPSIPKGYSPLERPRRTLGLKDFIKDLEKEDGWYEIDEKTAADLLAVLIRAKEAGVK